MGALSTKAVTRRRKTRKQRGCGGTIRAALELKPTDKVYLFDDHPEWVKNVTENDHAVSVPIFMPPYELYGVAKTHDVVPNTIPAETTLLDIVKAKLR